ncbi:MAG TPA: DNA-processing protein DprA [Armatimonadota bacterium]|jgi:DNA processing protein
MVMPDVLHSPEQCAEELFAWYALACAQLGARATLRLLEAFGRPEAVIADTPRAWTAHARLTPAACTRLVNAINRDLAADLARLQRLGVRLITFHDPAYPPRLRAIPDPPCALFVKGTLPPAEQPAIAIVGARRASPYGRHVAAELAAGLAQRGVVIVSGLALGADAAAHEGCLRAGGQTVAVLGCGVDVVYPPEHLALYEQIAVAGAVISEAPPGAPPTRACFPIRNRIISGLSLGVLVVEASEKSGALITAEHALEQGREVFAVPGSVNSAQSKGTHRLLREGAKLVESVEDILEELPVAPPTRRAIAPMAGPSWEASAPSVASAMPPPAPKAKVKTAPAPPVATPAPVVLQLPPEETAILALLSTTAKAVDAVIAESALSPAQVNAALLMLELKGCVQRRPGNLYVRLS